MDGAVSAFELTRQPLPDCDYKSAYIQAPQAIQKNKIYTGNFAVWETFKDEVQRNFQEAKLENCSLPLAYGDDGLDKDNNLLREHLRCGDEISVSGRFVQNALHVVSAVGKTKRFGSVFGDWKASITSKEIPPMVQINFDSQEGLDEEARKRKLAIFERSLASQVPDYCLIGEDDHARVVGEAKVPWMHKFELWWNDYHEGVGDDDMRQALGQIAYYMQQADLKYGFLTNYENTFFIKQELVGEAVYLFCSPPIAHDECASESTVSVRQCLLYLLMEVKDRKAYHFHNDGKTWVTKRGVDEKKQDFDKRVDEALAKENALLSSPEPEFRDAGLSSQPAGMEIRDDNPTAGGSAN